MNEFRWSFYDGEWWQFTFVPEFRIHYFWNSEFRSRSRFFY